MPDPDRQELVAVDGLEQHDRLLADHVEAHAVDDHFLHGPLLSRSLAVSVYAPHPGRPAGSAAGQRARNGAPCDAPRGGQAPISSAVSARGSGSRPRMASAAFSAIMMVGAF